MAFAWSSAAAESEDRPLAEYRSPSLELLVERLSAPGKHQILDLGRPVDANVAFLSQAPCRLHIEDLERHLIGPLRRLPVLDEETPQSEVDARVRRIVEGALTHDPATPLDIVLGWDLYNYLAPNAIRALMGRVGAACRPGTLLFILVPTLDTIPAEPAKVTLAEGSRVSYEPTTADQVPNPRYTPLALERMMPGFHLLHSFLLGDGMQDYLFTYR